MRQNQHQPTCRSEDEVLEARVAATGWVRVRSTVLMSARVGDPLARFILWFSRYQPNAQGVDLELVVIYVKRTVNTTLVRLSSWI